MKTIYKVSFIFFICLSFSFFGKAGENIYNLANESIFKKYTQKNNPYAVEGFVSRKYKYLENAYNLDYALAYRDKKQEVMLIGVGRGYTALEMALKYPGYRITAVNKEQNLFRPDLITAYYKQTYSEEAVEEALSRITVKIADIEKEHVGKRGSYDLIIFETMVLMYLEDKLMTVENLFNNYLKIQGALFFTGARIYNERKVYTDLLEKKAPESLFEAVREEIESKGNVMSDFVKSYDVIDPSFMLTKKSSEKILLPFLLKKNMTQALTHIYRNKANNMVERNSAPFMSVYAKAERRAAFVVSQSV